MNNNNFANFQNFSTNSTVPSMNTNISPSQNDSGRPSQGNPQVNLSKEELQYFEIVFNKVTKDGVVAMSKDIVPQYRSSKLQNSILKEIWVKCASNSTSLNKTEFFKSLLLVGLAQNDQGLTRENLNDPMKKYMPVFPTIDFPNNLVRNGPNIPTTNPVSNQGPTQMGMNSWIHAPYSAKNDKDIANIVNTVKPNKEIDLPDITFSDLATYEEFMRSTQTEEIGVLKGNEARMIFSGSRLSYLIN